MWNHSNSQLYLKFGLTNLDKKKKHKQTYFLVKGLFSKTITWTGSLLNETFPVSRMKTKSLLSRVEKRWEMILIFLLAVNWMNYGWQLAPEDILHFLTLSPCPLWIGTSFAGPTGRTTLWNVPVIKLFRQSRKCQNRKYFWICIHTQNDFKTKLWMESWKTSQGTLWCGWGGH